MSTFNGLVAEFPDIRVDYFRHHAGIRPPLACFLSHIHSDHLTGLESFKSPFIYCSAATKEMLLRLERYPCRINYAKGILEKRVQRYKDLRNLLKPLPLETPTVLELEPHKHIQVTLFDANHCPGAVMFLIEGLGKAVLYTGDIRSEPWFVNALARSPSLVEYTTGIKTLDTIYIDTSFTGNTRFQTKAEGIRELLRKVARYPADTIFHLRAWTYGYEDVWIALSKALKSKIHVDEYKMRMYRSLVKRCPPDTHAGTHFHLAPEAPALVGFMCGNKQHAGCLTLDDKVRLHSCEKGNYCPTVQQSRVVWIEPVVCHLPDGDDVAEVGVGGGGDDLEREAELDFGSAVELEVLVEVVYARDDFTTEMKEHIKSFLQKATAIGRIIPLEQSDFSNDNETLLAQALRSMVAERENLTTRRAHKSVSTSTSTTEPLPRRITFPYSRHSSLPELRHLVEAFRPKDVWPCTVDPSEWIKNDLSILRLFGTRCSGTTLRHDELMAARAEELESTSSLVEEETQLTNSSLEMPIPDERKAVTQVQPDIDKGEAMIKREDSTADSRDSQPTTSQRKRDFAEFQSTRDVHEDEHGDKDDSNNDKEGRGVLGPRTTTTTSSQGTTQSDDAYAREISTRAYRAMLRNADGHPGEYISLLSTTDNHWTVEEELGEG